MNLKRLFHTIRPLKFVQFSARVPVVKRLNRVVVSHEKLSSSADGMEGFVPSISVSNAYLPKATFNFLNHNHVFKTKINWEYASAGKLWTYNLNYFEYLEQPSVSSSEGYRLIDDFLSDYDNRTIGREPYPTSLRLIFWIRFFIRTAGVPERKYLEALHMQAKELQTKLEFHLLGNHLLENAFALFFTACYLHDKTMCKQAEKLLKRELEEQILKDGGHFELSPMYHQILTYRLLDVINMARASQVDSAKELLPFLEEKAKRMLGWMDTMTYSNGSFPLFNDAAYGIAPTPREISAYAARLNLFPMGQPLSDSGYRKFLGTKWEMFVDVGQPGPSYQPGHAHCDALSFVLNVNGKEVLVDTGTSVYGGNPKQRNLERGTAAHNTVQIDDMEQSEIWGEFRMARRAKVLLERDLEDTLVASHNGFYFKGKSHTRRFVKANNSEIRIEDVVHICKSGVSKARFHFHPEATFQLKDSTVDFEEGYLRFEGHTSIKEMPAIYSPEFGKSYPSRKLEVSFSQRLNTTILIKPSLSEK